MSEGAATGGRFTPRILWWLMALAGAAYFGAFALHPAWLFPVGVNYFGVWFLDLFAILASNDALARGRDVYVSNPLDYLQRPHVYSHWWLNLGKLGLTRADNFWLGLTLVVTFFSAAVARLRPRTAGEVLWYLGVLCSSPVLLAVHRANNDLVIFLVLAPVVPCLLSGQRSVRFIAVLLVAIATGLKFYPAAGALVLLAGTDSREVRWRIGFAVIALFLVGLGLLPDFKALQGLTPRAESLMTFGAGNVFGFFGVVDWRASAMSLLVAAAIAVGFARSKLIAALTVAPADEAAWLSFVLGATLLTGCFLTGMNFAYRWVFALWLAPWLWQRWHDPVASRPARWFARVTALLLGVVLWADPLVCLLIYQKTGKISGVILERWIGVYFMAVQPFVWAFFACLIGWLVFFVHRQSRIIFNRAE